MKSHLLAGLLIAAGSGLAAQDAIFSDQYYMGVGRWPCSKLVTAVEDGPDIARGQVIGWVLGFWSATTIYEPSDFDDKVENIGGRKIFDLTVKLCRENPDSMVGVLAKTLLRNTRAGG